MTYELPSLRVVPHAFTPQDICAGHPVLDFVNTAAGLNRDPRDWVDSFARLIEWSVLAGVIDDALGEWLSTMDRNDGQAGVAALERIRVLREALYTLLHAAREGTTPGDEAVQELQRWCRRAGSVLELRWEDGGTLHRSLRASGLDLIGASVALRAADFLSSPAAGHLGLCGGRNCGWLFLDTSRSRRRRWCDMATCGNAAKASRHYLRINAAQPVDTRK